MNRRILVLDGDCGAAIAIVQSLGRAGGYHITLGGQSFDFRAFRSRYVNERVLYPDPLVNKEAFQAWALQQSNYALIIPATERSLMPLHQIRTQPGMEGRIALPPADVTMTGFDKEQVRAIAERVGIPVPENIVVTTRAELASPVFDAWLERGAVVIKSIHSKVWGHGGGAGKELAVQMAVTREQLDIFAEQMLESGAVQLQQWVPGHGRGIEVLVDNGEIVLAFAHERLHELPLTGGGSCYRRAIEPPADLLESSQKLLRALKWHGVAMVEFRYDPESGRSYMMELNGRFWGSLPLAQFAGVDFPLALVELLLDGKRPTPQVARPVYARAFHRDIQWLKQMVRVRAGDLKRKGPPPAERRLMIVRPIARSMMEWGRVLTGRESWDGAAFDDPGPILWELAHQFGGGAISIKEKWQRRQTKRAAVAEWSQPLGDVQRILVLCSGNICRSAYVGARLVEQLAVRGIEVRQGALVGPSGRPSPDIFAAASLARGMDLSAHRSHAISSDDLAWADLILIMDRGHRDALAKRDAASLGKTRWLGGVAPVDGDPTVADPVDFGADDTKGVLDHMDRAIDGFIARLNR